MAGTYTDLAAEVRDSLKTGSTNFLSSASVVFVIEQRDVSGLTVESEAHARRVRIGVGSHRQQPDEG